MRGLTLVLSLVLAGCTTLPQREPPVRVQVGVAFNANGKLASFAEGIADPQSGRRVTPDDPVRVKGDADLRVHWRLEQRHACAAGEGKAQR